ncbi:nickel pincer cofactor biosynthesis protein LarC [Sporolactobacillus sp. THM7-7]|nr:nickel pincer cofactor biosynthesis protein LarC [Sporolactobacillus sp. THM7-7]
MNILYFDCFSGISGDMILGTLIDLGVDPADLTRELGKLPLSGYKINYSKKMTGAITGSDVDVILDHSESYHEHSNNQKHADHGAHSHHHPVHRHLSDCLSIINQSPLSDWVKKNAARVFEEVARAESHVHGQPINEVHFHEVGAVDSIIDIVGAFVGLELLGVDKVCASPLHDGDGFIHCAHGLMPVPVPAVAQMLASSDRKIPYIQENIPTELITPTGMAIIKTISADFGPLPSMHVKRIGYGTGKRDTGRMNALRGFLGEQKENPVHDEVVVLEANIDNQSSEMLGFALNRFLDQGALDAFYTPIYMKKNRPAVKLNVLAKPSEKEKMAKLIFMETATLGVRVIRCPRFIMHRDCFKVQTAYGSVQIKHATLDDIEKWTPEFDDCARLSEQFHVPLPVIYDAVQQRIHKLPGFTQKMEKHAKYDKLI